MRFLMNILYRYMEDYGYKYTHKMSHFVTTLNSRKNCSVDLMPKNVKKSEFCPFCTARHYEKKENPSLQLETKFASRSKTYPPGRVLNHNLLRVFEIVALSSRKPPTYTIKDEHDEIIRGKFHQKDLIEVI